ncbi:MAG TPA: glucose-6-phosphate dehydrogenase [Candidatus Saccharimonadales bacterium]|nr:glucose-6-phosphate dehydrogenase [Candidatus Saccharimonadales bacterium]
MNYERLQQPLMLVIFGITGDLAQRKLLPALFQLAKANELPEQLQIMGISRRDVSKDEVYQQLETYVGNDYDPLVEQHLKDHTEMRQMDLVDKQAYQALLARLQEIEQQLGEGGCRLYYLSIPSQAFTPIIKLLGETGHNAPLAGGSDAPRLLIEKPFGYDLPSARELVAVLGEHFGEGQIYRIDHYVAKETVQNILVFRFRNPLFDSIWNNRHIDRITVVAHEKIDIEGRANFYEQTGALRDFIQNHLLQLLAITTMARPAKLESDDIHAEKLTLLEAIQPIHPNLVAEQTLRGQYEGYRDEVGNPDSLAETFARVKLWIDNEQWTGIPVTLETGKALNEKCTEITICFRQPDSTTEEQNHLVFRIQPSEGITLRLQTKQPGIKNITASADMDLDYGRSFNQRPAEAYERVIVDAIRGDQTLFATSAEVIRSWEIVENVLEQWSHSAEGLVPYAKGSAGPVESSGEDHT